LTNLWQDYLSGRLPMHLAAQQSEGIVAKSYQILDSTAATHVRNIVPDVIANERTIAIEAGETAPTVGPAPSVQRLDIATDYKVLTIPADEMDLKGYRCFLAITDKIREQKGDFFLQPHRTSVVWGGQKALFVFEHQSGEFGLYYDIQTQGLIAPDSGGGTFVTCTIVMKNRVFIPIPGEIEGSFIPKVGEKKRFEVRCDILHIEK
jgi:molecular chaperone HtpG